MNGSSEQKLSEYHENDEDENSDLGNIFNKSKKSDKINNSFH